MREPLRHGEDLSMLQMIHVLLNSPWYHFTSGISIGHSDMSYACIFSSNRLRSRSHSRKCYQHLRKVSWQCSAARTLMVAYCIQICQCEEPSRLPFFCICYTGRDGYRIVGNFRGRRPRILQFFWLFTKVFSVKFGGVASFGAAQATNPQTFSPQKSFFSPIHKSFLP